MAIVEVKVPQFSESVEEGTLISWKKKPGEAVAVDEILIEVETDKVVLEVPAPSAGVLAEILVADGATVTSEQLLAKIDTEGKAGAAAPAAAAPAPAAAAPAPVAAAPAAAAATGGVAMPSAAKLMAEANLSASQVAGTGRDGRITKGDVLGAVAGGAKPAPAAAAPQAARPALQQVAAPVDFAALGDRPEERVPMSRLRARIAERLVQSQSTNAILTTFNEVNMKPVMDLRAKFKDQFEKTHGVKLGFMSFFVKAAVHALKKYPVINASVDGNDIVYHGYFDIGIAVGSPRGLV
ncbi:2-oxo acid dehydrogenase subunit E2, partial [uncultured Ralstonia sp.]